MVAITKCIEMMDGMKKSRDFSGYLSEAGVGEALRQLSIEGTEMFTIFRHKVLANNNFELTGAVVVFHIAAQNAGILVRKMADSACFESFELSPTNDSVMTTRGRLVREFPATAIEISGDDFKTNEFLTVVAKTLAKMSHQTVQEMKGKAWKADQEHDEDRDTTDPRIVTELLTSILRGAGKQISVNGIRKNTREEVMWSNSKLPWRRSPLWLLVRVALQLTMVRLTGTSEKLYKPFMAFMMAQVLEYASQQPTSSDALHVMMAKVSRRLCKLESPHNGKWLRTIQRIVSGSSELLSQSWKQIRERSNKSLDLKAISGLEMKDNIHFSLPATEAFLSAIPLRVDESECSTFSPTPHVWPTGGDVLPSVSSAANKEYLPFHLAMVESWVASHLDQWLERHVQEEPSCQNLTHLIQIYHSAARTWYSSLPEGASRMLLTIGELWIAADKAAIHAIPMLEDYDPEVPTEVWQALLFSSVVDMERLHRLEIYLLKRQKLASTKKLPSVFRSFGEGYSFPVRYFVQSTAHQEMKQRIENDATTQREAKRDEFRRLKGEYASLMRQYEASECEYVPRMEYGVRVLDHYSYACGRCQISARANNLEISVHEWPLPNALLQAQATVFELAVPPIFAGWRDATIYLVDNVLLWKPSASHRLESHYPMREYDGLARYFQSGQHRIHPLSEAKPHVVTHRRDKSVGSSSESDVCVNSGLRYQYYDESRNSFLSAFSSSVDISVLCTFRLPKRAEALEPFLMRTWADPNGKTPNTTIASQSFCPGYMSLGEFKSLCVLPYGYRLQWVSILTQLAMPTIDFNKTETATFLLQMSLQAGPNSFQKTTRCAHTRPSDLSFGRKILQNLKACISRVQENWESHTSLCSFTFLVTRLLSLVSKDLHDSFLNLLERCREISYRWLMRLIEKVQETTDDTQRKEFSETSLTIALICADSFNVENEFIRKILEDSHQASILVEASIVIYNNSSLRNLAKHTIQDILFDRWRHTMHRARSILLCEVMFSENSCLNLAVERRWPAFQPTSRWRITESTCYWCEATSGKLKVHLNILTGMLLVDGLPLSRLPPGYEEHHDYERLFGSLVLEVMPSSLPGMRFSTTKSFRGYVVHFGMQDSPDSSLHRDLLVHLNGNGSTLDLIPPRTFIGLLPHALVDKYAHWYDNNTGIIEFRPLENPWSSSLDNWRLSRYGESWKLGRHEGTFLLAPPSVLAQRIAEFLSPLEEPLSLHMLYRVEKDALEVQVPRLKLEFLLNSRESTLRSKQYRKMQIDADQSIGTLVGLTSKLVLRS